MVHVVVVVPSVVCSAPQNVRFFCSVATYFATNPSSVVWAVLLFCTLPMCPQLRQRVNDWLDVSTCSLLFAPQAEHDAGSTKINMCFPQFLGTAECRTDRQRVLISDHNLPPDKSFTHHGQTVFPSRVLQPFSRIPCTNFGFDGSGSLCHTEHRSHQIVWSVVTFTSRPPAPSGPTYRSSKTSQH